jgi:hypothetical protein
MEYPEVKELLNRGDIKIIAEKANVSPSCVSNVLNGHRRNYEVLKIALGFAKENKLIRDECKRLRIIDI